MTVCKVRRMDSSICEHSDEEEECPFELCTDIRQTLIVIFPWNAALRVRRTMSES